MKKISFCTLILVFVLFSQNSRAQNLFDINIIRTVEINFYDSNWDYLLDSLASLNLGTGSGTGSILATVIIDGTSMDSCGVRYKGNSSMDTISNKNPFNIDLNYIIAGQQYLGKDKIKLANNFSDPTMVREALMYEISNQYMDCPQGSFVKLYINGGYRGIYTNTESIDNEYLNTFYGSTGNPFFKCDPVSFQMFGDNSNLAYHTDILAYDTLYDMKSLTGQVDLQTLCFNLENNPLNIDQYLDVDRALWFLALSSAFVHNDGYTAFGHNYYVYKMNNGRWSIMLWDVNMSFGGLLWNGTNFSPLALVDLQNQDPFLHQTAFNFKPLIARLLSNPEYKKMYVAHYRTIMEENISNGYYLQRAEFMHNLIDADAQNEPYNQYSYTEFTDNIYSDVGIWFGFRPGLQNLMSARETFLNGLPEFQFVQPTISNILTSSSNPPPFSAVSFTADVINATSVEIGYRYNKFDVFSKEVMYDDGLHNDGGAGDGTYGADVFIFGSSMQYYIYAKNANASKFSPVRAEYEFYTLLPQIGLVINEIAASNNSIAYDQNFEYDDWIELYNNSTSAISLSGYHLSDNAGNPNKWAFPDTTIGAGEYLIIWADLDTLQSGLHANFSLSSAGENLSLSDNFDFVIDQLAFPSQFQDFTFGRYGNGLGSFMYLYPTFNAMNTTPLGIDEEETTNYTIYPNPATENVTIQFSQNTSARINISDLRGNLIQNEYVMDVNEYHLDVRSFEPGLYFIAVNDEAVIKFVVL